MPHDIRYDAPSALLLGGIGALGGLGYSWIEDTQRKNKLRNALIGASLLPALYIGTRALREKLAPGVDDDNPLHKYVNTPAINFVRSHGQYPNIAKAIELREKANKDYEEYETRRNKWEQAEKQYGAFTPEELAAREEYQQWGSEHGREHVNSEAAYNNFLENPDFKREDNALVNRTALLGYGTLGAGITVPALIAYMRRRRKGKKDRNLV